MKHATVYLHEQRSVVGEVCAPLVPRQLKLSFVLLCVGTYLFIQECMCLSCTVQNDVVIPVQLTRGKLHNFKVTAHAYSRRGVHTVSIA